jgi:hypothetical protein
MQIIICPGLDKATFEANKADICSGTWRHSGTGKPALLVAGGGCHVVGAGKYLISKYGLDSLNPRLVTYTCVVYCGVSSLVAKGLGMMNNTLTTFETTLSDVFHKANAIYEVCMLFQSSNSLLFHIYNLCFTMNIMAAETGRA